MKDIKNIVIVLAVITSMIITMSGNALSAGVVDTPHDLRYIERDAGVCSPCHIPGKSIIDILWFEPERSIRDEGEVGNLCFFCHASSGLGSAALIEASFSEKYVFPGIGIGKDSHGMKPGKNQLGLNGENLPRLPYAENNDWQDTEDVNYLQCTTCHNVHDNETYRPFLRDNIKELCVRCHVMDDGHPVEIETEIVKEDVYTYLKLMWTSAFDSKAAIFELLPFDDPDGIIDGWRKSGKGRWNLGRHLASDTFSDGVPGTGLDGTITCVTCHSVHGVQDDSDANTPINIPKKSLIEIPLEMLPRHAKRDDSYLVDNIPEFFKAIGKNDTYTVSMLIGAGIDINARDQRGRTPLIGAALVKEEKIAKLLIEKGADLEAKDNDGMTALCWAVFYDSADIANLLIKSGADINTQTTAGKTPLMIAIRNFRQSLVELLVRSGADTELKTKDGKTAIDLAREVGFLGAYMKIINDFKGSSD